MFSSLVIASSLGSDIFGRCVLLVDVVLLVLLCGIHTVVWVALDTSAIKANENAATRLQQATSGGLTVAGILIPLTILAVTAENAKHPMPDSTFVDFFVADVWFFVSIVAGLLVLYLSFYRQDIIRSKAVNVLAGYQLMFLLVGGFRLVWGFGTLVQTYMS